MKPIKSIVLITAGVLAFSACDKKKETIQTTTTTESTATDQGSGMSNAAVGAGAIHSSHPGPADSSANMNANDRDAANSAAGTGAVLGVGAATKSGHPADSSARDYSTDQGSGTISDEAASDELNSDQSNLNDDEFQDDEMFESSRGTGISNQDDMEYVDESSSEPNDVRGGRDARMVPKSNEIDNTSSEADRDQM